MRTRIDSFLAWSKTHQGKKLIRYTASSVITTGVSFTAIFILYGLKIIPGVIWATLAGNVIATLPSYHLNRLWAWGKRGPSAFRKEIVPYWSLAFAGIAFSQIGAFTARGIVRSHHWSHLANTALVVVHQPDLLRDLLGPQVDRVQQDLPLRQAQGHRRGAGRRRALRHPRRDRRPHLDRLSGISPRPPRARSVPGDSTRAKVGFESVRTRLSSLRAWSKTHEGRNSSATRWSRARRPSSRSSRSRPSTGSTSSRV